MYFLEILEIKYVSRKTEPSFQSIFLEDLKKNTFNFKLKKTEPKKKNHPCYSHKKWDLILLTNVNPI